MVSTQKKRQQNRSLLSQLDDFDQDVIIDDALSSEQHNVIVNNGSVDRDFTVSDGDGLSTANEATENVQTFERCLTDMIEREMGNFVGTVESRIQNAILTAIDNIITPRIELAVRSRNASSERDAASVTVNSERGKDTGITASFETVSDTERNNAFHQMITNDETRVNIPEKVSEFSVSRRHLDRQPHGNHKNAVNQ